MDAATLRPTSTVQGNVMHYPSTAAGPNGVTVGGPYISQMGEFVLKPVTLY